MVDSGSWYVRERWPHDGKPVESENFVVYSDAASSETKQEVADVAEARWAELLGDFAITPPQLQYPDGQDKLHIYAYRDHHPGGWSGKAYYGGLITWSPDHPQQFASGVRFSPNLQHELVHVLQWLISGNPDPHPIDVWFLEGLPEAVAGGTTGGVIKGRDQLNDLMAEYGSVSPVSVKSYSQITSAEAGEQFNYPTFQLAVDYLLDEEGHGRTRADAAKVLIAVAEGATFEDAFEEHMGTRLDDYEVQFFGLMDTYLPEYRSWVFSPIGFAVVSALVVAFVVGAPALGYRRWRQAAVTGLATGTEPGRTTRIVFRTEIVIAVIMVIVCFLGTLYAVGTLNELNNEMFANVRPRAYWTLAVYLVGSVALVAWAVHRWTQRSRLAMLVAPLVLAASGLALFTIVVGATI